MGHEAKDHIELKQQAKRLRAALEAMGHVVSHSAALELIAQSLGYRDWNTAAARHPAQEGHAPVPPAPNRPLWEMGGRVQGAYLGNRFEGTVVGVSRKGNTHHEISIDCDTPVNVSRSALFDAPRKRIRATIDEDGRSVGDDIGRGCRIWCWAGCNGLWREFGAVAGVLRIGSAV